MWAGPWIPNCASDSACASCYVTHGSTEAEATGTWYAGMCEMFPSRAWQLSAVGDSSVISREKSRVGLTKGVPMSIIIRHLLSGPSNFGSHLVLMLLFNCAPPSFSGHGPDSGLAEAKDELAG